VAPDIANVVAGGTKVQLVKDGFQDAQGAAVAPDGSLLFPERTANRIMKLDKDGNITTYMENATQVNGLAFDSKGRLIVVQFQPAQVGVLAPTKSTLVDKATAMGSDTEGSRRRQAGRRVLYRSAGDIRRRRRARRLLPQAGRPDHQDRRRHLATDRHYAQSG